MQAARNFALYGPSDRVIFVQPEDYDQGLIYRLAKGKGSSAATVPFPGAVQHRPIAPTAKASPMDERRETISRIAAHPCYQLMLCLPCNQEAGEQQSSRFELFFDLLFVGMVHQISEAAADQPTGLGFAKYILTFVPVFSIWGDSQRAYILWIMMLLVGYSNNASAIELGGPESEDGLFTDAGLTSMHWMLGFFVVAKASRVLLVLIYGLFLPLSRKPLFISVLNAVVSAILFLIAIFTSLHVAIALVVIASHPRPSIEAYGPVAEILGKKYAKRRLRKAQPQSSSSWSPDDFLLLINYTAAKAKYRFPATNIEHHVERLQAFVTIVLGEMVVNIFFKTSGPVGLNMESGRAFLNLMIAFNFNWIYFRSPASKHFIHAIRRSWFAGFLFTFLHLPLCMSLLLASSAVTRFVSSPSIDSDAGGGLKWFFGAGPRHSWGIYVGITSFIILEETIGQIEKREQDLEAQFERKEEERFAEEQEEEQEGQV
ncbi:hypothetical protein B0H16DRAFT_1721483 [Mycena metata]|uniref:Uncharacterized protein n=1 Tax=Mycena metata TaxID=1033252 RepID=A0AAD7J588_9AGAR|nr:hypothetical protein B0H16DRAFT_1721483 [Mycena metata]